MTSSILSLAGLLLNNIGQTSSNPANTQPSIPLTQPSQSNGFGQAVVMDLSPAAMAAMNGSQSGTAAGSANPISNISANVFSKMALTYSAGNTGPLNTHNSLFDQLFGGTASGSGEDATSGSAASGSSGSGTASLASNSASSVADATSGTSSTTGAQAHSGHHHHGGGEAASSSSSSGSGTSTSPLALLLSSLDGSSSSATDTLLSSIV